MKKQSKAKVEKIMRIENTLQFEWAFEIDNVKRDYNRRSD